MMPSALPLSVRGEPDELAVGAASLGTLLDQLVEVLVDLDGETYRGAPMPNVSGSVGGHTRHILDHVSALLAAAPGATLSYDRRERGTAVELDPAAALRLVLRLNAALPAWVASRSPDEPMWVEAQVTESGGALTGWSTVARELAFVIGHTIHHQALIAVLLACHGVDVPPRFGYAPSTPSPK